jgi:hypothetical protein
MLQQTGSERDINDSSGSNGFLAVQRAIPVEGDAVFRRCRAGGESEQRETEE